MKNILRKKGFTLIELLVVIAIIGILASLIIVSLSGARSKATDTQLKNNARNIDTALAQYYQDNNSVYITPGGTCASPTVAAISTLSTGLTPYLSGGASSAVFTFSGVGTGYLTAGTQCSIYGLATGLKTTSESPIASGNGVYCTNTVAAATNATAGNCNTAGTAGGVIVPSSTTMTITGITGGSGNTSTATNRAFATYGPQ